MKYDLDRLRQLYERSLGDSEVDLEALRVFDDVVSGIHESVDGLVTELTTDPKFLHYCAGKATGEAHDYYTSIGNLESHPDFVIDKRRIYIKDKIGKTRQKRETFLLKYEEVWGRSPENYDPQFEVTLMGSRIGSSYAFRMYWIDNTHDLRRGSNVEYALLVSNDEVEDKIPRIADNPEVLISSLRGVFPFADNSQGTLKFREGTEGIRLEDVPK